MTYLEDLTGQDILGVIVWYSIGNEVTLGYETFRDLIKQHQAPLAIMKAPKPENVFRRACKSIKHTDENAFGWVEVKMIDQGFDKTFVRQSLFQTITTVDLDVISAELAMAIFNKKTKLFTWEVVNDSAMNDKVERELRDFMATNAEVLHALPLRESIRKSIEGALNGISVKETGGTFFVPKESLLDFQRVTQVFTGLDGVEINYCVLGKDTHNQNMVSAYFVKSINQDLSMVEDDIIELKIEIKAEETVAAKHILSIEESLEQIRTRLDTYSQYQVDDPTAWLDCLAQEFNKITEV